MRKLSAIMIWTNGFDFFAIIENFLMRYYRIKNFSISVRFRFFDNFLRLEKLAQINYTEFLINTKLQKQ